MTASNYVRDLRELVGPRPVNWAGVCALVVSTAGEVLLQRRSDTGGWGTLGGIAELGEALEDTLRRELLEEAGITLRGAELLTIVSGPDTYQKLPNGDEFYQVTAVYVVRAWEGVPLPDGDEGVELRFFPLEALPERLGPVDRRALGLLRDGT
ncbi:NUDIX domain-containing protein [Deinococcus metallilatus]|uniref:8-oxo-dGTP pyrophosphatase MutT (NUDIX family) n=1 Tax=Deinococcus metallilatus TaxID=1211322 RepID=A0AAJ5JXF4_9DEIO|nr:NUDIX hydrolase [Deinococcus metallilatus]MBB5297090.1 8-oxo-dGTP pyrophosphatase MutT (NUDIX family) [Deinococcus metallilatus]QBY07782.1 NUDIX domain-containing protein [Deinococcus metallilatus]RXJ13482.1 NUDIX domain-containing protein [Deinococcus metallilatus]TLK22361.1 NUDIX hydrolase [Deinococcus metallilatus]GMA17343.1 DNA mismatch repair protein MutT [Deinococcus metallilatus]